MIPHMHTTLVEGCFRCDLNRDEVDDSPTALGPLNAHHESASHRVNGHITRGAHAMPYDPAAFDRWLTTQYPDEIERAKLEDTLSEKIANMFDEVNVRLPEEVLVTAVNYAVQLAEEYVEEITARCERCGRPIDEDNSAKDRQDPTIWVCAGGYGCDDADERDAEWTMPVPTDLIGLLVAGLQRLQMRDDRRAAKGKARLLTGYESALIDDAVAEALTPGFRLYYGRVTR